MFYTNSIAPENIQPKEGNVDQLQEIPRLPLNEINLLAHAFINKQVFTDRSICPPLRELLIPMIFLPATLMARTLPLEIVDQCGMVYQYFGENQLDGLIIGIYPVFTSCRILHVDDVPIFMEMVTRLRKEKQLHELN